ncbi:MAG: aspartate/glutamate racemase family protein [Chloroflexota bacterium]
MNVALPDEGGAPVDRDGDSRPIGVFDSGVGGLSVVRHLQQRLPQENLLYFADQAHIPYGGRTVDEITAFSTAITRFLIDRQAKAIVVACNTATAAAIDALRVGFPDMPFVGMEPALKPAAAQTQTGKIGVLATPGTFASRRYAMLVDRFAKQVEVFEDPCVGLVSRIEAGRLADGETARILDQGCHADAIGGGRHAGSGMYPLSVCLTVAKITGGYRGCHH